MQNFSEGGNPLDLLVRLTPKCLPEEWCWRGPRHQEVVLVVGRMGRGGGGGWGLLKEGVGVRLYT